MAVATSALIIGGLTAAKGYLDYRAGKDAANAAKSEAAYNAEVFGRNADLAEEQAVDALARGRASEMALRRKGRGLTASQRASFAAQGLDINSGSAMDVQQNDIALSELDALTIRNNAQREALGFRKQAAYDREDAELALKGGRARANAITKEATYGTLLTTSTSLAATYAGGRVPRRDPYAGPYTASGARRGGTL